MCDKGAKEESNFKKGWNIQFKWKYVTQYWIPLKDIKEYNPADTAEYTDSNKLLEEMAFKWWDRKVLKKKDRIIYRVKSRYWRKSHKFGINLPHSVEEDYAINEDNGNTF